MIDRAARRMSIDEKKAVIEAAANTGEEITMESLNGAYVASCLRFLLLCRNFLPLSVDTSA